MAWSKPCQLVVYTHFLSIFFNDKVDLRLVYLRVNTFSFNIGINVSWDVVMFPEMYVAIKWILTPDKFAGQILNVTSYEIF